METIINICWYKKVRIHDIRGSYIDKVLESGLSIKFAQNQAVHSRVQTTLDIYARNNKRMKKKAMEVLNDIFSKRKHM